MRLRVTAQRAAQDAAAAPLHEELLDRAAFEERAAQAAALAAGDSGASAAAPPGRQPSRLEAARSRFSALRPFCIISLSYLLFTTTDGAVRMVRCAFVETLAAAAQEGRSCRRLQAAWRPPRPPPANHPRRLPAPA